jgi:hypothetical protein
LGSHRRTDVFVASLIFIATFWVFRHAPIQQAGDSQYSMLLAESLLRHGDFLLDRYHLPESDYRLQRIGGHVYYSFPPGTSVLSVPLVAVAHARGESAVGPDGEYSRKGELRLDAQLSALLMAFFSSIAYATARVLLPVSWSLAVASVSAFGTQVFSTTSRAMWSDTWGIVLVGLAVCMLFRSAARRERLNVPWLGTLECAAYFVRPTNALVVVGTIGYLACTHRKELPRLLATIAMWAALFFAYSWRHFHKLVPDYFSPGRLTFENASSAFWGNLVSPGRGLFVYVPALIAIAILLVKHWRGLRYKALVGLAMFVFACHMVVLSGFGHWWGGHSYGARLTTSLLPWFVLLGVIATDAMRRSSDAMRRSTNQEGLSPRRRVWIVGPIAGLLCIASVIINAIGAFSDETSRWNFAPQDIDQRPARLWCWRRPQFLAPFVEPPGPFLELPQGGLRPGSPEAEEYLGLGWAIGPEGEFRWTDGREGASVRFSAVRGRPGTVELQLRPYLVPGKLMRQQLIVSINAHPLATITLRVPDFETHRVLVPAALVSDKNVLRMSLPDAARPSSVENANDRRTLGVAVRAIRWEAAAPGSS